MKKNGIVTAFIDLNYGSGHDIYIFLGIYCVRGYRSEL